MNIPLKRYWNLLVDYLRPQWARAVLLNALLLSAVALQLLNPQFLRRFIDAAASGAAPAALTKTALYYIVVALLHQLIAAYGRYVGEDVGWTATNFLRADLASHCLRLDMSFHKTRTPGEMIERIDGDVNALANFFSQFVVGVAANGVLLLGVLVLLWRIHWSVGLGISVFTATAFYVMMHIRRIGSRHWAAVRQANAEFYGFLGERLSGTEDIRACGAAGYVMAGFDRILRRWFPLRRRADFAGYSLWLTNIVLFALGTIAALGLSAYLYEAGLITIGTAFLIFNYTELIRRPLQQIRTQMQDLQKAGAAVGRVENLLDTVSRITDGRGVSFPEGPLEVAFDRVSFAYENDEEPVVSGLDFTLRPGRVLGLLGRTGSGKTTLARLLFRLYDPTAGEIRLGGVPIREARLVDLRQRVGMVTQEVQLFHASVRDNLTFFERGIPNERILAVLDELGLERWCASLPDGLETELGSGGAGLSAGQAQLLAFGRLLLADPSLVILDEASSRLDPATERLLEHAVDRVLTGRTGIIIAHRLATVEKADEIMILEAGRVIEYGERLRLARDENSHFHRLLDTGLEDLLT